MLTRTLLTLPVLALALAAADTPEAPKPPEPPSQFYRLDFTIREVEGGKVLNARSYSMTLANDKGVSSIRASSRVPISTGAQIGQYQFFDVGVRIDSRVIAEMQGGLALYLSADISSVPPENMSTPPAAGPPPPPTVRQNNWKSNVVVPLKKPTVVYSSDDPASKRQMQLEVTATPLR